MERSQILTAVRAAAIALVLVAIVVQANTLISANVFDASRFFAYFTIQSNLIGVVVFMVVLANRGRPRGRGLELLRGAAVANLSVTFFVVIFLLSGVDVQLQIGWIDVVLHKLFPIVVALDWILDPPTVRLSYRDALLWLAYPLAWTPLTLVRGAIDGWYPYPFLDPANGGYGQVAVTVVAILVGFLLVAAITSAVGNARTPSSVERAT